MPGPDAYGAERDLALAAAERGAALAAAMQARGVQVRTKANDQPVTDADLAVDRLLRDLLLAARPEAGWLSEESAASPDRLGRRALWLVDPIDGTRDYLRGRPGWAVSVALAVDGEVVAAALVAPALGLRYAAARGAGATLGGRPLAVSGRGPGAPVRLPLEPHALASPLWGENFSAESVGRPNSLALRLALVADGRADAVVDGRTAAEWDVAAAALLVSEAGGLVTGRNGSRLAFNKPDPSVPGIVAATPAWHAPMQARLSRVLEALAGQRRARAAPAAKTGAG